MGWGQDADLKQAILNNKRTELKATAQVAKDAMNDSITKSNGLIKSYEAQIAIIQMIINRMDGYCKAVPEVDAATAAAYAKISPLAPGTYGDGQACPPGAYCPGGSVSPPVWTPVDCPNLSTSSAGAKDIYDCKVPHPPHHNHLYMSPATCSTSAHHHHHHVLVLCRRYGLLLTPSSS